MECYLIVKLKKIIFPKVISKVAKKLNFPKLKFRKDLLIKKVKYHTKKAL